MTTKLPLYIVENYNASDIFNKINKSTEKINVVFTINVPLGIYS